MKKDKRTAVIIVVAAVVILTISLICFFLLKKDENPSDVPAYSSETDTTPESTDDINTEPEVTADTEEPLSEDTMQPSEDASSEDTEEPSDTDTEETTAPNGDEGESTEFEVPDTVLPDVEDVTGNDWFDTAVYETIPPVTDSYFDDTIFIGDSRTEGMELYGGQKNMNTFSYKGLSIDKISTERCIPVDGVNCTVEEAIAKTDYKNYYIQFGINELGWVYVDKFSDGVSHLIDIILEHNPEAVIYVSSVVSVTKSTSDTDSVFNIKNVEKFNTALYDMCKARGDVVYLDLSASVADENGYLPEEASTDGKHCNADYCRRMIKYIRMHAVQRIQP